MEVKRNIQWVLRDIFLKVADNGILLSVTQECYFVGVQCRKINIYTTYNIRLFINIHPDAHTLNLFNLLTPSSVGTVV